MRIVIATILLLMAGAAFAVDQRLYVPGTIPSPIGGTGRDQNLGVIGNAGGGGGGCSNSLDFSDGCNSQYIGAL